jgi:hypothetical protein
MKFEPLRPLFPYAHHHQEHVRRRRAAWRFVLGYIAIGALVLTPVIIAVLGAR